MSDTTLAQRIAWDWEKEWENQGGEPTEVVGFCVLYPENCDDPQETIGWLSGSFSENAEAELASDYARRLVACWNACQGISLTELEAERPLALRTPQMVDLLILLADGCPKHPSYRAKRKVFTICERCNAMWEARQTLSRLRQNGGADHD